jgi:hypothetical protein
MLKKASVKTCHGKATRPGKKISAPEGKCLRFSIWIVKGKLMHGVR